MRNKLPAGRKLFDKRDFKRMKATSSLEFLKAHAVISRSWLLAQIKRRHSQDTGGSGFFSFVKKDDELIRWYDRDDHTIFDVCADDHCQRYQGITKATNIHVEQAVRDTRGQILMYDDEICDARFSKCCGGITEEFQYCWGKQSAAVSRRFKRQRRQPVSPARPYQRGGGRPLDTLMPRSILQH